MHKKVERIVVGEAIRDAILFVEEFGDAFNQAETDWDEECLKGLKKKLCTIPEYHSDDSAEVGDLYRDLLEKYTQVIIEADKLE